MTPTTASHDASSSSTFVARVRPPARNSSALSSSALAVALATTLVIAVETLRHSGVRVEELIELTHLSVRQYQRANGEIIALLVIAPSKTDRERVIPMSAELFHAIASIIRRHTRTGRPIPLVSRYDPHDKEWSAPIPFLFQRQNGTTPAVFCTGTIQEMISRRGQALAEAQPGFRRLKFTPHDFRRIFATELVNSGLPIHIGAALLGHLNIQTTRGYVKARELHQTGEKPQVASSWRGPDGLQRYYEAAS